MRRAAALLRTPVRLAWSAVDACTAAWRRPGGRAVVLCFGDSNTWGYIPGTGWRYRRAHRWPGVLARRLADRVFVVEAGRNGRTTNIDDGPASRNGVRALERWLARHPTPDHVILCLGTNDLKQHFGRDADAIGDGLAAVVATLLDGEPRALDAGDVLLLCPSPLVASDSPPAGFIGREEESRRLAPVVGAVAARCGCGFIDAAQWVSSSPVDGVHLDRSAHARLGEVVADWLRERIR